MADNGKKTKGRRKIEIVRMQHDSNRLVTFSKRRGGLFKKASELCTLCGVDAAIIVFSPGRKAFSFGHPSVDATLNRFLFSDTIYDPNIHHGETSDPQDDTNVLRSNMYLMAIGEQIELARKQSEELHNKRKPRKEEFEWLNLIEQGDLGCLKSLHESLNPMKDTVAHLNSAFGVEVRNADGLPFTVPNAPPDMAEGQNHPMSIDYDDGLPYQMAMVPTPLVGGPSNYDHSQLMMENTPIGGFGDPSLTVAQNDMAIDHLNANTNNVLSCVLNPMEFNFPTQHLLTSFQGENNSMAPMGMGFNPGSVDFENFASSSSSMSRANEMNVDGPVAPFTFQDGFAFDNGGFGFGNGGFGFDNNGFH